MKATTEERGLFLAYKFRIMHVIRKTGKRKSPFEPFLGLPAGFSCRWLSELAQMAVLHGFVKNDFLSIFSNK